MKSRLLKKFEEANRRPVSYEGLAALDHDEVTSTEASKRIKNLLDRENGGSPSTNLAESRRGKVQR